MKEIKGLQFNLTCAGCPEQYDVFDKEDNMVGYVRLRHGYLPAEYPDVGGKEVYSAETKGDGCFSSEKERMLHLNKIADALLREIHKQRRSL